MFQTSPLPIQSIAQTLQATNKPFSIILNSNSMPERKLSKFLKKLFSILDNPEYHDTISWNSNGENLIIKDQHKMEDLVIPEHFSLTVFSSFVRQLHLYDFHKKKSSNGCLVFQNDCFLRDKRNLALKIVRKRKTKSQIVLLNEAKQSEKTIESNERSFELNQFAFDMEQQDGQDMKSYELLELVDMKSYQDLLVTEEDPYDILSFV